MDIVDKATRSRMMSNIRGRNTAPELILRRALHKMGFRFRLHVNDLPGKPDIVFPKFRAVLFVHGCFWHRHRNCRFSTIPATRPDFWRTKLEGNVERDNRVRQAMLSAGWRVGIVWECALRKEPDVETSALIVGEWLKKRDQTTLDVGAAELPFFHD